MALSRRLTLGMAAVAAAPSSLAAADEDDDLLELCDRFHVAWAERNAWVASATAGTAWEVHWDALTRIQQHASDMVLARCPRTMRGAAAQAQVVLAVNEPMRAEPANYGEQAVLRFLGHLAQAV